MKRVSPIKMGMGSVGVYANPKSRNRPGVF
jgi:hypothetical protein